ncbi:MAG: acyl-CoA dehydrogenase C-terminal domain-containing protein, partial [Amphritea sp.]|nr:acyl-CoA dehydrogenase C-terminal domain-containing protein [Amphritea sp.]
QGLAVSEGAYQHALQYAKDRIQGSNRDGSRYPIIRFPDVRRMLMQMKSGTEAMRALCFVAAADVDRGNQSRVDLLTPIVKGWVTEFAQELTSLGVQVHGGMGFIEETGAAQFYRDARILTIYEGTTGIQALDLVGRKTLVNGGESLAALLEEIAADVTRFEALGGKFTLAAQQCRTSLENGIAARQWLLDSAADKSAAGSSSVNFMMLFGYLCGGWLMAKSAMQAQAKLDAGEGDSEFLQSKLVTAQFFCEHLMTRTQSCLASVMAGSDSIMALDEEQF